VEQSSITMLGSIVMYPPHKIMSDIKGLWESCEQEYLQ
jgi:hypothetical protein